MLAKSLFLFVGLFKALWPTLPIVHEQSFYFALESLNMSVLFLHVHSQPVGLYDRSESLTNSLAVPDSVCLFLFPSSAFLPECVAKGSRL